MAKRRQGKWQRFAGIWSITKMSEWDKEYCNMEVQAFISIKQGGCGEFQFGLVQGDICGEVKKSGDDRIFDFTWEGQDELDAESGDGWFMVKEDGSAEGEIRIHRGDKSMFWAKRRKEK
ncbi:MAG: hypothetical protein KJ955_06310 [Nanoarchaeota archaeon]|nr:hypothetical protein [Nanoarchaeota archaeon]